MEEWLERAISSLALGFSLSLSLSLSVSLPFLAYTILLSLLSLALSFRFFLVIPLTSSHHSAVGNAGDAAGVEQGGDARR